MLISFKSIRMLVVKYQPKGAEIVKKIFDSMEQISKNSVPIRINNYRKGLFIVLGISCIAVYLNWNSDIKNAILTNNYFKISTNTKNETTLAETLEREVRILCWVMTTPANHKTKALHVARTWGKRCNRLLFVTSAEDDELETLVVATEDTYDKIWGKTKEAFRRIYEEYSDEADWFMKADDDTYVFLENLRYLLYPYSPDMPIYFGHNFKLDHQMNVSYMSGGSGYILSKEALRRFTEIALKNASLCYIEGDDYPEDVAIGNCLQNVDVFGADSRDTKNRLRFLPFLPHFALWSNVLDSDFWYFKYMFNHGRTCRDCLSKYGAAFHYITPEYMIVMEFFTYEFDVFGLADVELEPANLPAKLEFEDIIFPISDNMRDN